MSQQDLLLDLLAARATQGLSVEDSRTLNTALCAQTEFHLDDLDLAAAAADLAFASVGPAPEAMPDDLKRRILAQAPDLLAQQDTASAEGSTTVVPFKPRAENHGGWLNTKYLGWYVAAAMLAMALWAPWESGPIALEQPLATSTLAEQRSQLIQTATDVVQVAWAPPEIADYAQVAGDVVWSDTRQTGYMRLQGLPANSRSVQQYQLWIVDSTRDARPIDGGVFDIPAGVDEVIVPIDAKLRADNPTVFAITLEQPGGVVVSDGPLLVVAVNDA